MVEGFRVELAGFRAFRPSRPQPRSKKRKEPPPSEPATGCNPGIGNISRNQARNQAPMIQQAVCSPEQTYEYLNCPYSKWFVAILGKAVEVAAAANPSLKQPLICHLNTKSPIQYND